jgi:hypothetical protein
MARFWSAVFVLNALYLSLIAWIVFELYPKCGFNG